jgi:hypothetical protein
MVTIVKSEWHQVEKRYGIDIDEDIISEIYPDFTEEEVKEVLEQLVSGEITVETLLEDAENNGVYLDFDWLDEDDWWTDRKGGYEVTYEVSDDGAEPSTEVGDEYDPSAALEEKEESGDEEDPELFCFGCLWEGKREEGVVEDNLLMCPSCSSPVGHTDDSEQEEANLDDLRNQLYSMMKKDD